jgi:hypothetical protein
MIYDPFDPFNEVPMYFDIFLKFKDADEANEVLFTEQTNVQGDVIETVLVPKYAAVDVVGTIYKATGQTIQTQDGENYYTSEVMESVPGWHVNVRHTDEAPELEAYKVTPQNPVRGWA